MLIKFLLSIAAIDIALLSLVHLLRPHFPWLITPTDKAPIISADKIAKHAKQSFHPDLGWLQKNNASWSNMTANGKVTYHTDNQGRRLNPGFDKFPMHIAVYGDSYAFCRLVPDDCTWPHYMSKKLGFHVGNFGVGNYGFDQALLRYEMNPPTNQDFVIIAVVPETIARVHSYWKHYFEYGNLLAFKPRFRLHGDELELIPSPIRSPSDYGEYIKNIDHIQSADGFYRCKFLKDLIRFPALVSIARQYQRHIPILFYLAVGWIKADFKSGWKKAFKVVLRENAKWTQYLYREKRSCKLLEAIIKRFADSCYIQKTMPLLVVLPQPSDLRNHGTEAHEHFFASMNKHVKVIDFTNIFKQNGSIETLFVDGELGPHTSVKANKLIADELARHVQMTIGTCQ